MQFMLLEILKEIYTLNVYTVLENIIKKQIGDNIYKTLMNQTNLWNSNNFVDLKAQHRKEARRNAAPSFS